MQFKQNWLQVTRTQFLLTHPLNKQYVKLACARSKQSLTPPNFNGNFNHLKYNSVHVLKYLRKSLVHYSVDTFVEAIMTVTEIHSALTRNSFILTPLWITVFFIVWISVTQMLLLVTVLLLIAP